ncbi:alanine racemase, partial [Acinetobacter baumannii]
ATVAPVLAAAGCTTFFVALLDEGIALRPHLPADCDIVVLNGLMPKAERAALAHGLIPVLNSLEQVDGWTALARREQRALPAFIQLDSGM